MNESFAATAKKEECTEQPGHVPVGMGAIHSHYIRPIPPTYVTEYEQAYTWPTATKFQSPGHRHPQYITAAKGEVLSNWILCFFQS